MAAWLSSGQVTVRLEGVHECIPQADPSKLKKKTKKNIKREHGHKVNEFNNLFQNKSC